MTRYTKLERKRHVDAGESFAVTPLMPAKKVEATQATQATPAPASAPAPAPAVQAATTEGGENTKDTNKKRKAEDSPSAPAKTESGEGSNEGAAKTAEGGPASKKAK